MVRSLAATIDPAGCFISTTYTTRPNLTCQDGCLGLGGGYKTGRYLRGSKFRRGILMLVGCLALQLF